MVRVIRRPFGDGTNPGNKMVVRNWNPVEDTALPAEQFCGHCRFTEYVDGADTMYAWGTSWWIVVRPATPRDAQW